MDTNDRLMADLKESMKKKNQLRVSTIRLLKSAIKNAEIEKKGRLSEDELKGLLMREAKKRKESIKIYREAGRDDLAEKESIELRIVQEYLPEQLGEEEITVLVDEAIAETGAAGGREIGKVMAVLMPKVRGKADGAVVSGIVKEKLENG